jgi:hypothetical protein
MADPKPVHIISDSPETDNIAFGFDKDAKTIDELIANKKIKPPWLSAYMAPGAPAKRP